MDDNVKKTDVADEEYHFSEAENADVFGAKPKGGNIFERINRRHLLMGIGAIIVILSLYKLIGVFLATSTTQTTPITQPTPVTKVIVPTKPVGLNSGFKTQLATMQAHDVEAKTQLQKMTDGFVLMSETMANLKDTLTSMNQQLQAISESLEQQREQIATLKPTKRVVRSRKAPSRKVVTKPRLTYYIQAMIPGRAWLQSSAGTTLTVQKGDVLPRYGKISLISPVQGIIRTRSGAIIRYKD